jgi:hypothetical protein
MCASARAQRSTTKLVPARRGQPQSRSAAPGRVRVDDGHHEHACPRGSCDLSDRQCIMSVVIVKLDHQTCAGSQSRLPRTCHRRPEQGLWGWPSRAMRGTSRPRTSVGLAKPRQLTHHTVANRQDSWGTGPGPLGGPLGCHAPSRGRRAPQAASLGPFATRDMTVVIAVFVLDPRNLDTMTCVIIAWSRLG